MQLRQAEALGMLDHHQRGIRHIDADFNHRGRHQQMQLAARKALHHGLLVCGLHSAMDQADLQVRQRG